MQKNHKNQSLIPSIAIAIYYLLDLTIRVTDNYAIFMSQLVLGYGILVGLLIYGKINLKHILIVLAVFFFMSMSSILIGNIEFPGIAYNIQYYAITLTLLSYTLNRKIINILFYSITLFFFINFILGMDANQVFITGSRNMVSTVYLNVLVIYYVTYTKK